MDRASEGCHNWQHIGHLFEVGMDWSYCTTHNGYVHAIPYYITTGINHNLHDATICLHRILVHTRNSNWFACHARCYHPNSRIGPIAFDLVITLTFKSSISRYYKGVLDCARGGCMVDCYAEVCHRCSRQCYIVARLKWCSRCNCSTSTLWRC